MCPLIIRIAAFTATVSFSFMADYFGVSADYLLVGYEDGDLYFSMMDAQRRGVYEKLGNIAVLCSNAENLALGLMESEVKQDV